MSHVTSFPIFIQEKLPIRKQGETTLNYLGHQFFLESWLNLMRHPHMSIQMAALAEALVACLALIGLFLRMDTPVDSCMCLEIGSVWTESTDVHLDPSRSPCTPNVVFYFEHYLQ